MASVICYILEYDFLMITSVLTSKLNKAGTAIAINSQQPHEKQ
ncbi:hypothetical protein SNOG_06693 [Parastagonospora nodorum SN15]|uniref:Uncharacterized protein n=1 Tax=Phaeosphaeria nodorum (strain SN15 / ATCC MYA-4574 / FGSC 10173) TaxID=321614 RepID=Q0UNH1_PHANO|nr:hypothetical protein SNOG_06693 [Parastagonospora nodorum SN15]EAT85344.1 hypothetical protein SNOG_06693 [Parastagonospora nodorum SN15]